MADFPDSFHTARLILRPIALADAAPIFTSYAQDREVTRYLTWRPHRSVAETEAYVAACLAASASRTYVITGRADQQVMGALDLRRGGFGRLGFGYVLARRFWGHGLMAEALTDVADWALRQADVWRIGDVCDIENVASARVMEKSGFIREGVLRRWTVHPNLSHAPRDCISYARVR